ncbi:MAG: hypothetical protein EHM48_03685 [Planctomycetaceae bacterium]|nr:MAG: hypothetical protein EHM48_03685 [Planctomycetaceae bacterium]
MDAVANGKGGAPCSEEAQGKEIAQQLAEVSQADQAEMKKLDVQLDNYIAAGQYDQAIDIANAIRLYGGNSPELVKKIEAIAVAQTRDSMQRSKGKSSAKTTIDPFTGAIVPEKGTSSWGEGKGNETLAKAANGENAINDLEKKSKILRAIALMEFDKQLQLSGERLTGADNPARFDAAAQAADAARNQIASNKAVFDSPQEYEDKLRQAEEQIKYVALQRETFQKRQSAVAAASAESVNHERVEKLVATKRAAIAALTAKSKDLNRDQRYAESLAILDQILLLDSNNDYANSAKDVTIQLRDLHTEKVAYDGMRREFQANKVTIRESEIPLEDELQYPKNWVEQAAKREGYNSSAAGAVEADSLVKKKLRARIPKIDFNDEEFGNVVEFFRPAADVNFRPDWRALESAGVTRKTKVNLNLVDVSIEKALQLVLQDLSTTKKLSYAIGDGVVTITTSEELAKIPVYRTYDVQDLLFVVPDFTGPTASLGGNNNNAGGNNNNASQDTDARSQEVQRIIDTIRQTVGEDSWQKIGGSIREFHGQLIVSQTAENQEMIAEVLSKLRQARGPQVEINSNIAQQRASGTLNVSDGKINRTQYESENEAFPNASGTLNVNGVITSSESEREGGVPILSKIPVIDRTFTNRGKVKDEDTVLVLTRPKIINQAGYEDNTRAGNPELSKFIADNYGWIDENQNSDGMRFDDYKLISKLDSNLGQKVAVNSTNINVSPSVAARAGVQFNSDNGMQWATIDEAQFRTLMELDAQSAGKADVVPANARLQETIVGTDALFANGMTGNVAFAGDRGNSLTVNGSSVALPHESYLLINNGRYLTAVRAGAMQHWTTPVTSAMFAPVPQTIEVPRVGQLVNLEKTLLESNDRLVISAEYTWKGVFK